jgi:hypothetical protein
MRKRLALIIHPFYLFCLLLLLSNDHVFKVAWPSALTGKLSDFAGLFVVGVLAAVVYPPAFRSRAQLMAIELALGATFVSWKIGPVEPLLNAINSWIGYPWLSRTVDATDLIALPMLAVAFAFVRSGRNWPDTGIRFRRVSLAAVLLTSGFAVIATTPLPLVEAELRPAILLSSGADAYPRTLFEVEQILTERGVIVAKRWEESTGSISLQGVFDSERSIAWRGTYPKKKLMVYAQITLVVSDDRTIELAVVRLSRHGHYTQSELEEAARWIVSGFAETSRP